jgi:hypothetical protein
MKNRVLYLIPSARIGGTETMLATLAASIAKKGFDPLVVTMNGRGPFHDMLDRAGVPNRRLDLRNNPVAGMIRLIGTVIDFRPRLIHSFLFWGNLLGKILRIVTRIPLITSQRSTDDWKSPLHWYVEYFPAALSAMVVSNSSAGVRALLKNTRVPETRIRFIPSGIPLAPLETAKPERITFGFPEGVAIVGSGKNRRVTTSGNAFRHRRGRTRAKTPRTYLTGTRYRVPCAPSRICLAGV